MANIPEGQTFISGRSQETARALLAAAASIGADPTTVRTTIDGYHAPDDIVAAYEKAKAPKPVAKKASPKKSPAKAAVTEAKPASEEKE